MKHRITGTVLQTLHFELNKGESVYSEAGRMSWMSNNVKMSTGIHGGIWKGVKRKFAGESFFMTSFKCEQGVGTITFANEFPGRIIELHLSKGKEYICQKDAFMCAEPTVKFDLYFKRRLGAGLFGGEGFILQRLYGKGKAFVSFAGEIIEYNLKKDQSIRVDTGHIAMYEPGVDYSIERVKGLKNIFFGGEGLFLATLSGPGKVWLQSMPLNVLAAKIGRYISPRGGGVFG
jgi:uncharacterized protein (TIGR00266 family)